jgi:hypothetical protein
MNQTLVSMIVLSCMCSGILAHAQKAIDRRSGDDKSSATAQASADQSTSKPDPMKIDCPSSKKKQAKHHKRNDRMKQDDDPQPDKDAPQNHVEYGGGGF